MNATILATQKTAAGHVIRIQKRRGKFDVIRNSNGYAFYYVEKAVSEERARNTFYLLTI
jgi:hypothetical protein